MGEHAQDLVGRWVQVNAALFGCAVVAGCAGIEPSFQSEGLAESEVVVGAPYDPESEVMDFDEIRAAGLEGTLSEGPPPPPFTATPDRNPPNRRGANLEIALHGGEPALVDVLELSENAEGRVAVVRDVGSGEITSVVLPTGYQCGGTQSLTAGNRYVLITSRRLPRVTDRRETEGRVREIYSGIGEEYAVMPVERGVVDTHSGPRDAAALVAEARGGA